MLFGINKKPFFLIVTLITILAIVFLQLIVFSNSPKLTLEILKTISSKKQNDFYGVIVNIPTFNPRLHSDGCSGGMSLVYSKLTVLHEKHGAQLPWRSCCVVHDQAYYYGGTKQQKIIADQNLKLCVSESIGEENLGIVLGKMMEKTVSIGGSPYFPTSYRWGYGEDFRDISDTVNLN